MTKAWTNKLRIDKQTEKHRQIDRQTNRWIDEWTGWMDILLDIEQREKDKQILRLTDR